MHHAIAAATIASLLALTACAPAAHRPPVDPHDASIITRDQLERGHFRTLYGAISKLRANWLHARGPRSLFAPSSIVVYFNEQRLGGIETLRSVPASDIAFVRHYNEIEAMTRWGMNHADAVIYISTQLNQIK